MSKYNAELDIEHENSLSIIIKNINPNSKVLEFGPAHGRLTRYLRDAMKCDITIVEIDEEAGKEAAQFASQSFIGNEQGDIEKYHWLNTREQEFDYIIFADVLEHLYNPDKVLQACERVLKENGRIFVSIPNISHNSIIVNLINDQFKYNSVGLLDNTHIKFFTYYSFIELVKSLGYEANNVFATYSEVGENEISSKYDDVELDVQKALKNRALGRVYQYIFEIGRHKEIEPNYEIKNCKDYPLFEFNLYIKENSDNDYSESKRITKFYSNKNTSIKLDLTKYKDIESIRVDPMECDGIIKIKHRYRCKNGIDKEVNVISSNARGIVDNDIYFFNTNDPQIILDIAEFVEELIIELEIIEYQIVDYRSYDILINTIKENSEELERWGQKLEEQIRNHKTYEKQLLEREEQYKKYQETLENRIDDHKLYQEELDRRLENHKAYVKQLEERLDNHKAYEEQLEKRVNDHKDYVRKLEEQIEGYKEYQLKLTKDIEAITEERKELIQQTRNDLEQISQMKLELEEQNSFIEQVKKSKLFRFMKIK